MTGACLVGVVCRRSASNVSDGASMWGFEIREG